VFEAVLDAVFEAAVFVFVFAGLVTLTFVFVAVPPHAVKRAAAATATTSRIIRFFIVSFPLKIFSLWEGVIIQAVPSDASPRKQKNRARSPFL
jgi:hypothetical protein